MAKIESKGFFCVVYFLDTKKTCYYHKVHSPYKLAFTLKNWKWIKIFLRKEDYHSNPKANNYFAIFDENNPVSVFNFKTSLKR